MLSSTMNSSRVFLCKEDLCGTFTLHSALTFTDKAKIWGLDEEWEDTALLAAIENAAAENI